MYNKILIRYGELTLKGKNRDNFVNKLAKNIKIITGEKPEIEYDRMFLSYNKNNMEKLKYVFGIISFSPILQCNNDINEIQETAMKLVKPDDKTFKISARRNNKNFELKSNEINNKVGAFVLKNITIKVDVHNPDCNINIEVRKNKTYIFREFYDALGGLPVGSSGEVLHLISGGIDSPVAAFELMKRGLKVSYLSFITPPQTDEKTVQKIKKIVTFLNKYQGESKLYFANYSKVMNYIAFVSNESYKINLMRRSFYRIASIIASENKIIALSNGENLGQVASQTLESLSTINEATNLLVLRPLLTNDKIETIEIAKQIGTYNISIEKAKESCELFAPKKPVTKPNLETSKLLEIELKDLLKLENDVLKNQLKTLKFSLDKKQ